MNTFCPECGTKLKKEVLFCPECGFKIKEAIPHTKKEKLTPTKQEFQRKIKNKEDKVITFNLPIKPLLVLFLIGGLCYGLYFIYEKYREENSNENISQIQNIEESKENKATTDNENDGNTENKKESVKNNNSIEKLENSSFGETEKQATKFMVIAEKAYFYDTANTPNSNNSYLIAGDYVEISPAKSGKTKLFVHFTNSSGITTSGYIRKSDLQAISEKEIQNTQAQDERNKEFIRKNYEIINNGEYKRAYKNYLNPKAKNLETFIEWFSPTCGIDNIENIEKVGFSQYKYKVFFNYCEGYEIYEVIAKIGKVNGDLKILNYTSKKID